MAPEFEHHKVIERSFLEIAESAISYDISDRFQSVGNRAVITATIRAVDDWGSNSSTRFQTFLEESFDGGRSWRSIGGTTSTPLVVGYFQSSVLQVGAPLVRVHSYLQDTGGLNDQFGWIIFDVHVAFSTA